mmetsp:Transcript_12624/g.30988  ORF Transcript_12624/g.30988 Transcript_12624/m.30988 type:complete len:1158 (+) Transcript_12624:43-3516(+)|eukprot:CAMPEP_0206228818 /NCGR_PEP_ID=MMETSP0047_2-20121206/9367_1 /ASSEMBLY_ACC=CAM_ASM_000192 /TAXON_ID=195065 /ORGANISM="Chroomonas mesostigmatica_cf, Strain CCMP1168" /LENGTH=1157 /DNA_ID=CAMNT_0053652077 /DNA_START=31 /DNA_END=3504 /DNA_ORIENTATION=+
MSDQAADQGAAHVEERSNGPIVVPFTVPGIGGGFLAIDSFSESGLTAGGIRMGAIGVQYPTVDDARADACKLSAAMSEKNRSSRLGFGGCKTVVYCERVEILTAEGGIPGSERSKLFDALAVALGQFLDKILVGPDMFTSNKDLAYLRSKVLELYPNVKRCPVTPKMLGSEDHISVSTAWSAFGALHQIAKSNGWPRPKAAIQGLGNVGGKLRELLSGEGWEIVAADPVAERMALLEEGARRGIDEVIAEECDIFVPCARGGILTLENVDRLRCKVVAGAANVQIPPEIADEVHKKLEERGITHFNEALINVGGVSCAVHSFLDKPFDYQDAFELGASNMRLMIHETKVGKQYNTDDNRQFYADVMGSTDNIHFGLWDGVDLDEDGAYEKATENLSEWMWAQAMQLCTVPDDKPLKYVDLGAGTGAAARLICKKNERVSSTCLNLCRNQNRENRQKVAAEVLKERVEVVDGTFDRLPDRWTGLYDGCYSQDAFVHAYSKEQALAEALRVTKGGGWLILSDLHCGEGPSVSGEELHSFAQTNMANDWQTPEQMVATAKRAGWSGAKFIDLTAHIKLSFQLMLKKVARVIASGEYRGANLELLETYRMNFARRVRQVEQGVFRWGALTARKPYEVCFVREPPVQPAPHEMIKFVTSADVHPTSDVVVVTILDKLKVSTLPFSIRAIVTLSAGLDHVDTQGAKDHGVVVLRAGGDAIVESVADYLLSTSIFVLRNGFQTVGMRFPERGWDLKWNADGIDLNDATIGIIGMGNIAMSYVSRLRKVSKCKILYNVREGRRRATAEEARMCIEYATLDTLLATSDLVVPLCALVEGTQHMLGYNEFAKMKPTASLINAARGKVVDTDGLTRALEEGKIRHAFLDTTDPEPLPVGHPLLDSSRCTITPHFATNTSKVRRELVDDVTREVLSALDGRQAEWAEFEAKARADLVTAHTITRKYGMDELVWNHMSARLPSGGCVITPGGMLFDEIRKEDLHKASDNVTADIIHAAVYEARPDVKAIVHLHTPATVAVSCLEDGFMCLAQESAYFHDKVAYHDWEGISDDIGEKESLMRNAAGDCNILLMNNHGFCAFGRTVAEAWVLAYYFDKSCRTQLNVMQTGGKIRKPDPKVLAHAAKQSFLPGFAPGEMEWAALERLASRKGC